MQNRVTPEILKALNQELEIFSRAGSGATRSIFSDFRIQIYLKDLMSMPSPRLVTDSIADWGIQVVADVLTNGDYGNYVNCAVIKKEGRSTIIFTSQWFCNLSKELNEIKMNRWVNQLQPLDKSHETFIFQICDDA